MGTAGEEGNGGVGKRAILLQRGLPDALIDARDNRRVRTQSHRRGVIAPIFHGVARLCRALGDGQCVIREVDELVEFALDLRLCAHGLVGPGRGEVGGELLIDARHHLRRRIAQAVEGLIDGNNPVEVQVIEAVLQRLELGQLLQAVQRHEDMANPAFVDACGAVEGLGN